MKTMLGCERVRGFLGLAGVIMAFAACEPIAPLPPPQGAPQPGAPRLELRADGSYLKDGRVVRAKLSEVVRDDAEVYDVALESEHDYRVGRNTVIAGLSMTLTGMATVFPGLIARSDPVAVIGGVHLGVGLCVLAVAQVVTGAARWERRRAIDVYNKSAGRAGVSRGRR